MLPALTGPVLAAAGLLALAAPGKLLRPASTANALGQLGLPRSWVLVRLLGVAELALAVVVWFAPSRPVLGLLAAAYVAFAGFVAVALRRGTALSSCGCFGRPDTPPTRVHLAIVSAAALAALAACLTGAASVGEVVSAGAGSALPLLAAVGLSVWLAWVALAVLPRVVVAARGAAPPPAPVFAVPPRRMRG
jgi:hypothetical protein